MSVVKYCFFKFIFLMSPLLFASFNPDAPKRDKTTSRISGNFKTKSDQQISNDA